MILDNHCQALISSKISLELSHPLKSKVGFFLMAKEGWASGKTYLNF
jgi:hypothetical protein